jgi:hypothetical protein
MKLTRQRLCCFIVMVVATAIATGTGCGPKKPPPSKPSPRPATEQQVQTIRDAYNRAYPDSRVGVVTGTLRHPSGYFVSVGEVSAADFREGQTVTFVDSQQRVLTTGTVVRILADQVHVLVDAPKSGGRMPGVGDVMVKLPFGATTL